MAAEHESKQGAVSRRLFIAGSVGTAATLAACSATTGQEGGSASQVANGTANGASLEPTDRWSIANKRRAPENLLEAYAGQSSVLPGEIVDLHVSTAASNYTTEAFRIGYYENEGGARVGKQGPFKGKRHSAAQPDSRSRSTPALWPVSGQIDTTGWEPGFYLIHVVADKYRTEIPLIVRSESAAGKVVYVATATTWQAYNNWGGRSLYSGPNGSFDTRSFEVSFDRPYSLTGRNKFMIFDIPIIRVVDESDAETAWFTNVDIALDPSLLDGATAVFTSGHDEYWPVPYREAVTKARNEGSNVGIMGANTCYWRVRLKDSETGAGRRVVCYKSSALDPVKNSIETTARWRDSPKADPENKLVGQLYDAFPAAGPLEIRDPNFWMFADTGVKKGDKFAGLLGPETDRLYPLESTPRPIQVAALSDTTCRGIATWSTMTYYTTKSGAGVLATGTMAWVRALPRPKRVPGIPAATTRFAHQTTLTALDVFAQGPAAKKYPARDDFNDVKLPAHNTSGAA